MDTLSSIVLSEPALTARLLRMANSAMMRRGPLEITDVKTAMSRVGLDVVQNAAVSLAANEAFHASEGSPLREYLDKTRKHSIKVCALAYALAKKVKISGKPDEAMLAGLLHAIGRFYILTRTDDFPEEIVDAVDEHELLDRENLGQADITDVIIVANLLANADEEQTTEQPKLDRLPSVLRMKIDGETVWNIMQESDEEIRSMTQALAG